MITQRLIKLINDKNDIPNLISKNSSQKLSVSLFLTAIFYCILFCCFFTFYSSAASDALLELLVNVVSAVALFCSALLESLAVVVALPAAVLTLVFAAALPVLVLLSSTARSKVNSYTDSPSAIAALIVSSFIFLLV